MKQPLMTGALALLAACSTASYDRPSNEAVRDYIVAGELAEQDRLRTNRRGGWTYVNDRFIIFRGRDQDYLLEFRRECRELLGPTVVADVRRDHRNLRPRMDTISGCVIQKIYAIDEGQSIELKALGEAPGDRN